MKIRSRTVLLSVAAGTMAFCLCLWAERGDAVVPFPDGYRRWAHLKSTVVGSESAAALASERGIHHFYANEQALEAFAPAPFPMDRCSSTICWRRRKTRASARKGRVAGSP